MLISDTSCIISELLSQICSRCDELWLSLLIISLMWEVGNNLVIEFCLLLKDGCLSIHSHPESLDAVFISVD